MKLFGAYRLCWGTILCLLAAHAWAGEDFTIDDAVSSHFSVHAGSISEAVTFTNAVSSNFSVHAGSISEPVVFTNAVSTGFSVHAGSISEPAVFTNAVSPDFSVHAGSISETVSYLNATSKPFSVRAGELGVPPVVVSIGQPAPNLTRNGPVNYSVEYTGAEVITLTADDVSLIPTGTAFGSVSVSGTGSTRMVTVFDIGGDGTLAIDIAPGTAENFSGDPAPGAMSDPFTVDSAIVDIAILGPSMSLTNTGPIDYTIEYINAALITLNPSDISLAATGTANASIGVSGSGTSTRTVTLFDITGDGSLAIQIAADTAQSSGGGFAPGAGPSSAFTVDNSPPVVTVDTLVTIDEQPELTGTINDSNALVEVTVDGQTFTATNEGDAWTLDRGVVGPLTRGVYDVAVTATDSAGNAGTDDTTDELTVLLPGSLEGSIVLAGTETPVTCAAVQAESLEHPFSELSVADLNGSFRLPALLPGLYQVTVFAPGFETQTADMEILEDTVHGRNFHLFLRPGADLGSPVASPGTVRGSVFDEDTGDPLVGVRTTASIGENVVDVTFTCADGTFEAVIGAAKGELLQVDLDFELANYDSESRSTTVEPDAGAELDPVPMKAQLIPVATLAGVVSIEALDAPLPGARVTVLGPVNLSAESGTDGVYMVVLPKGRYRLEASAPGHSGAQTMRNIDGALSEWSPILKAIPQPVELRDVNGDGVIDAIDVQLVINAALGIPVTLDTDVNGDGDVDAVDVQLIINGALGVS